MNPKPAIVFDNNVLVSALLFEQSVRSRAFYAALDAGEVLLSAQIFTELSRVLARPKFDRYVTREDRAQFLAMLLVEGRLIETMEAIHACRDPKDDKFLELAVSGSAASLVTGDDDLLTLNPFRGVSILTPSQFLAWISEKP